MLSCSLISRLSDKTVSTLYRIAAFNKSYPIVKEISNDCRIVINTISTEVLSAGRLRWNEFAYVGRHIYDFLSEDTVKFVDFGRDMAISFENLKDSIRFNDEFVKLCSFTSILGNPGWQAEDSDFRKIFDAIVQSKKYTYLTNVGLDYMVGFDALGAYTAPSALEAIVINDIKDIRDGNFSRFTEDDSLIRFLESLRNGEMESYSILNGFGSLASYSDISKEEG